MNTIRTITENGTYVAVLKDFYSLFTVVMSNKGAVNTANGQLVPVGDYVGPLPLQEKITSSESRDNAAFPSLSPDTKPVLRSGLVDMADGKNMQTMLSTILGDAMLK